MLFVPAIHLPHGREVFKPLPHRPTRFKQAMKWFSERALLQCVPGDALVLSHRPDDAHLRFLLDRGLGTETIYVCEGKGTNLAEDILDDPAAIEFIAAHGKNGARFYIHLEEEDAIARKAGLRGGTQHPALTRMFNTLYFLIRLEEDLGIPALERVQVRNTRLEAPLRAMREKHEKLFVRGNESCGGTQAFVIDTEKDIAGMYRTVARNRRITRYFAAPFMEVAQSWNVQYALADGAAHFAGASRQTLEHGYAHKGNIGGLAAPDAVRGVADKIAGRLAEMGGRGIVGIDLFESGGAVYPAEINARENTSTPVIAAWQRSGARFFRTLKAPVPRGFTFANLKTLAGDSLLFDPMKKRGAIPFHFKASTITGTLDVALFADSEAELAALAEDMEAAFAGQAG